MSKEIIRKIHSYQVQRISLHEEFRTSFMEFNSLIHDFVIQSKRIIRMLSSHSENQEHITHISIEKETFIMESLFYKISKISFKTDEILQNIAGLEFSSNFIIHQFTIALKNIEIQYNHLIKYYKSLDITDNLLIDKTKSIYYSKEFQIQLEIEFVLLQEVIQNSIPAINLLFDELNHNEKNISNFSNTNNF